MEQVAAFHIPTATTSPQGDVAGHFKRMGSKVLSCKTHVSCHMIVLPSRWTIEQDEDGSYDIFDGEERMRATIGSPHQCDDSSLDVLKWQMAQGIIPALHANRLHGAHKLTHGDDRPPLVVVNFYPYYTSLVALMCDDTQTSPESAAEEKWVNLTIAIIDPYGETVDVVCNGPITYRTQVEMFCKFDEKLRKISDRINRYVSFGTNGPTSPWN